jgi:hypothetical protein
MNNAGQNFIENNSCSDSVSNAPTQAEVNLQANTQNNFVIPGLYALGGVGSGILGLIDAGTNNSVFNLMPDPGLLADSGGIGGRSALKTYSTNCTGFTNPCGAYLAQYVNDKKTLTSGTGVELTQMANPVGVGNGGSVNYTTIAENATNACIISGTIVYAGTNGVTNKTLVGVTNACNSTNTMTDVWGWTNGDPSFLNYQATVVGFTPTTMYIRFTINNRGDSPMTVF